MDPRYQESRAYPNYDISAYEQRRQYAYDNGPSIRTATPGSCTSYPEDPTSRTRYASVPHNSGAIPMLPENQGSYPRYHAEGSGRSQLDGYYNEASLSPRNDAVFHSNNYPSYGPRTEISSDENNYWQPTYPDTQIDYTAPITQIELEPAQAPPAVFREVIATDAVADAAERRRINPHRFFCRHCSRGFTAKHNYDRHVGAHNDQRPHNCDCGAAFTTKSDLKRHQLTSKKHMDAIAE